MTTPSPAVSTKPQSTTPNTTLVGNVYLVGLMGSGKTTVGRMLARRLGKCFVDSDHEIEKRMGVPISTIFAIEGEAGFREREMEAIAALVQVNDLIMATGGGAVIRPENRRALKSRGVVIYLRATAEELFERTRHDRSRPLLQTDNPLEKLNQLLCERDRWYREVADIIIDTSRQSAQILVDILESRLSQHSARQRQRRQQQRNPRYATRKHTTQTHVDKTKPAKTTKDKT